MELNDIGRVLGSVAFYEIKDVPLLGWIALTYAAKTAAFFGEVMTGGMSNIDTKTNIRSLRYRATLSHGARTDEIRAKLSKEADDLERKLRQDHERWTDKLGLFAMLPTPVDVGWAAYKVGKGIYQHYYQSDP